MAQLDGKIQCTMYVRQGISLVWVFYSMSLGHAVHYFSLMRWLVSDLLMVQKVFVGMLHNRYYRDVAGSLEVVRLTQRHTCADRQKDKLSCVT